MAEFSDLQDTEGYRELLISSISGPEVEPGLSREMASVFRRPWQVFAGRLVSIPLRFLVTGRAGIEYHLRTMMHEICVGWFIVDLRYCESHEEIP